MLSGLASTDLAYISSICELKPPFINILIAAMRVCEALRLNDDIAYRQSEETGCPALLLSSIMRSRTSHLSSATRLMKGTTELIGVVAFSHASSQFKWELSSQNAASASDVSCALDAAPSPIRFQSVAALIKALHCDFAAHSSCSASLTSWAQLSVGPSPNPLITFVNLE